MDTTKDSPLNISLDTQFMVNFLLGADYLDENLDRIKSNLTLLETGNSSQVSEKNKWEAIGNYRFQRNNYFYIKFLRHLVETGKIKINVTPTVFSEFFNSKILNNRILEFFKDNLVKDYLTIEEIREIINKANISQSHKNIFLENYTADLSNTNNAKKYPHHIEYSNDILYNNKLKNLVINILKYKIFKDELSENANNLNLIHFPKMDKDNNPNELLDSIMALSFNYRLDKKDVLNKQDLHSIPAKEINDSTIMSICSHLGLPLITGDFKGLVNHQGKIELENQKLSNIKNEEIKSLPFSLEQFIVDFYKDEFMEFIDKFSIPEEQKSLFKIDEIIKSYNSQNIRNLLMSEELLNIKDIKTLYKKIIESYHTRDLTGTNSKPSTKANIDKFNSIHRMAINSENVNILNPNEIINDANKSIYDDNIHFVSVVRKSSTQKTILEIRNILKSYHKNIKKVRAELSGLKTNSHKEPATVYDIAYFSQMTFLDFIKPINHLLQTYHNTSTHQLYDEMREFLDSLGIVINVNECGCIEKFNYKGIILSLKNNRHLNNTKQLSIDFNVDELEDETLILLATNPTMLELLERKDKNKCRQLLDKLNNYCKTNKSYKDKKCVYPPNIYDFQNIYKNNNMTVRFKNKEVTRNLTKEQSLKISRLSNYILNYIYKEEDLPKPEQY